MKQNIIIWAAIGLVTIAVMFPPYGYTRISVVTIWRNKPGIDPSENVFPASWTYLRHQFLFSPPPTLDHRLKEQYASDESAIRIAEPQNIGIAWRIVIVEVFLVLIFTFGILFTINRPRS